MRLSEIYPQLIFFALLVLSNSALAASNCVYDKDLFTDSRFKKNFDLLSYVWDDSTKQAKGITNSEALFSVKYWSCNHYGIHAVLMVGPYPRVDTDNINQLFLVLAKLSMGQAQIKTIKAFLMKKTIAVSSEKEFFSIESSEYSEFYLSYAVANESLVLDIKLYKD